MHAIASFTLVPIDSGISVSPFIAACERLLESSGLNFEVHANSTDIEGDWAQVFDLLRRCHETVHAMGAPRIHTVIQVGTRTDREQKMVEKLASVIKRRPGTGR